MGKDFWQGGEDTYSRTRCEIYTRVMGYYRPVTQFNRGKKSEYYSRTYFDEQCMHNSRFIDRYK